MQLLSVVTLLMMLANSTSALLPYSTVPKLESAELCAVRACPEGV